MTKKKLKKPQAKRAKKPRAPEPVSLSRRLWEQRTPAEKKALLREWIDGSSARIKRGHEIYETRLRQKLEKKFKGKMVCIETHTGDYFIGDNESDSFEKALEKYPNELFYFVKVGLNVAGVINSPRS